MWTTVEKNDHNLGFGPWLKGPGMRFPPIMFFRLMGFTHVSRHVKTSISSDGRNAPYSPMPLVFEFKFWKNNNHKYLLLSWYPLAIVLMFVCHPIDKPFGKSCPCAPPLCILNLDNQLCLCPHPAIQTLSATYNVFICALFPPETKVI
jgi:hypothetical protein